MSGRGKPTLSAELIQGIRQATERAALAAYDEIGRGDEKEADRVAVEAMRAALKEIAMRGRIVIGEGERDKAPMLFIGEEVGTGSGTEIDIAVDPLECTTLTVQGRANALAVAAAAHRGCLLHAPDVYMEKIAIGGGYTTGLVSLAASPAENVKAVAKAKGVSARNIKVCVLERKRHEHIVEALRSVGAAVYLIPDGDVAGVINTTDPTGVDIYMGVGGAPEGVLAAAALHCVGGQMETRLILDSDEKRARAKKMGVDDPDKIYRVGDLVQGDVIFSATGVTHGTLLRGCEKSDKMWRTQSLVLHAARGEKSFITTESAS